MIDFSKKELSAMVVILSLSLISVGVLFTKTINEHNKSTKILIDHNVYQFRMADSLRKKNDSLYYELFNTQFEFNKYKYLNESTLKSKK